MEVDGQSESKPLVEVKMAGIQRNGSGPGSCSLEVVLAEGRRIEVRRDFESSAGFDDRDDGCDARASFLASDMYPVAAA